ncbi:uncharacterized protein LOC118324442 [Morone saxatilis]|uniref:uncharacterized protein LOC118324442 n=1 Tax=Morone saxatilis TaxID=34816 RepID=UPI0015E1ED30|nr:uncharacterized protein LOC118324442 [Morone saxatilis]
MMMMMMMRGVTLIFVSYVWAQVNSQEIKVECHEFYDLPPVKHISPSFLADLKVELLTGAEGYTLNISWEINIDASIQHLTGTRIVIDGETPHHCRYNPPLANLTTSMQKWFHYLVRVSYGHTTIQVANLPLPQKGSGSAYKRDTIKIPKQHVPKPKVPIVKSTTCGTTLQGSTRLRKEAVPANVSFTNIVVAVFGVLAVVMILVHTCFIIYKKNCGAKFATLLGFKMLPTSLVVPVPVLVVYPAENVAFQRAVVALAEFLQWQGDCSVAIDMWQQGKIAELGPMRWLAEQAKAADRVLIVCPQPSSQPSDYPPNHILPDPSIPAAAHDLYPLILNMVASHAKSASDLAKFWVVQLGEKREKRPSNLALELTACKTFCLMKDLSRLYRSLHQDNKKIPNLVCRPGVEQSNVKLREAIEKLVEHQQRILKEVEPLKSVVTTK